MSTNSYNKIAGKDTGRIIAISDGVFAVAMTLLVLEIRVPILETIKSDSELITAFIQLKSKFLVYFLAFITTGIFWMGHAAQYKHIEKSDRNLSWINLIFLLTVTLLPFTTAFLGDYTNFRFPIFIYWINILLMGLFLYINWKYACKKEFIPKETIAILDNPMRKRIIAAQSLYFLGTMLCFINPYLSIAFIIFVQLNYAFAFLGDKLG